MEGGKDFFGTTVSQAWSADGTRNAASAVEACSAVWRQGLMQLGSKQVGGPDTGTDHPIPPLVACTLGNGAAAVFPATSRPAPGWACPTSRIDPRHTRA